MQIREGQKTIPSIYYEDKLIKCLQKYLQLQQQLELNPPVLIMLSLIGVKDYIMSTGNSWSSHFYDTNPIDRDNLIIPEVLLDDFSTEASDILCPAFDAIWQACGWDCCKNYDASGNWIGNRR